MNIDNLLSQNRVVHIEVNLDDDSFSASIIIYTQKRSVAHKLSGEDITCIFGGFLELIGWPEKNGDISTTLHDVDIQGNVYFMEYWQYDFLFESILPLIDKYAEPGDAFK